jgi:hypothetical protein
MGCTEAIGSSEEELNRPYQANRVRPGMERP